MYSFERDHLENWMFAENYFTNDECKKIIKYGNSLKKENAETTDEKYNKENNIRKGKVAWINYNENSAWIFDKLSHAIKILNEKCFKFDIYGIESLQFAEYNAPNDHFKEHIDRHIGTPVLKLSLSIQLSDPQDYEGGELELIFVDEAIKMPKAQGTLIAFPSYTLHKVTPITKGKRYSVVAWAL